LHSAAINNVAASLAEHHVLHQQMVHTVAHLAQGFSEAFGQMGEATAATLAERDAMHAAAIESVSTALAHQNALHEQMMHAVNQIAQAGAESSAQVAAAAVGGLAELQQRINELEGSVADLHTRLKAIEQK
jgi:uncharacterized coiled-coil protein SlyX